MILGFNKSPGAYIETEYPSHISEDLGVKTSDLMNIYALHRMRNMEPNYIQMKIKNVAFASFYSGFSFKHYVGRPNYCITVFLSEDENPSIEFEGMLRRIAYELLPNQDMLEFEQEFEQKFQLLEERDIDPYWEEYIEGEGSVIATIQNDEEEEENEIIEAEKNVSKPEVAIEEFSFDKQFDLFEKEELQEELKKLKDVLEKKEKRIEDLTKQITAGAEQNEQMEALQSQLDEANGKIEDWTEKLVDLNEKNAILGETVRKLTEMSTMQNEEMERQGQTIIELRNDAQEKEKENKELLQKIEDLEAQLKESEGSSEEAQELKEGLDEMNQKVAEIQEEKQNALSKVEELQSEVENMKKENEVHLETIANLKIDMKILKETGSSDQEAEQKSKDEIISLKKDIKVLRRERDHYKNIVKENDLL